MNILMTLANPFTHDPRVYNEARSLVKAGHNVTVFAWDKKKENPLIENKDEINIVRSYNSKLMEILPYDLFRMHYWWYKGYKDIIRLHKKNNFDIVHCHDLDTLPIGVLLKKKFNLPLIYDAHEIWGYMISRDLPIFWANCYLFLEKIIIKYVDTIITVNEPLKTYFSKITNKPITIIMNCKPLQSKTYKSTENKKFTLLYIGTLEKPRFLLELVDVVKNIEDIYCIIGGRSKKKYAEILKKECIKTNNVNFIGSVDIDQVLPMTKNSDIIICMTDPKDPNNSRATANKQFEAMVCGRPIICTKDTYPGIFTEKNNCGLVADFNKKSLKDTIINLKDNPKLCIQLGKKALNAAIKEYNWEMQERKLTRIYLDFKK